MSSTTAEAARLRVWAELHAGMRELFTDNYDKSEEIFLSRELPLYKLGASLVMFLRALLTWGQEDCQEAKATIKRCETIVEALQKADDVASGHTGVTSWFKSRPEANLQQLALKMTTIFLTLMRGLLNFLSLHVMGYLKGAMKMKSVQKLIAELDAEMAPFAATYGAGAVPAATASNGGVEALSDEQECYNFINGGLLLAQGAFNMALSLFPKNLLKVAEWFGFHSDRNEGVAQLIASTNSGSISSPMAAMGLLSLHSVEVSVQPMPVFHPDLAPFIDQCIERFHETSSLFSLNFARLRRMAADLAPAVSYIDSVQCEWKKVKRNKWFERALLHSLSFEFREAAALYEPLCEDDTKTARIISLFTRAACFAANGDYTEAVAGFEEMLKLLKSRKGAISSEQVFFKRRAAFFVQDLKRLLVAKSGTPYLMPLLERMHYQNEVAQMMPPQTESAIAALDEVSKTYVVSGKDPAKEMHWMAAQALLTGARLRRRLRQFDAAEECLQRIVDYEASFSGSTADGVFDPRPGSVDYHIYVFAVMELAFTNLQRSRASYDEVGPSGGGGAAADAPSPTADPAARAVFLEKAIAGLKQTKKFSNFEYSQQVGFWTRSAEAIMEMDQRQKEESKSSSKQ